MDQEFRFLEVFKAAWTRWTRDFVVISALFSVSIFFSKVLRLYRPSLESLASLWAQATKGWHEGFWVPLGLFVVLLVADVAQHAYCVLMALDFLSRPREALRSKFDKVFQDAASRLRRYLLSYGLLWVFFFTMNALALIFIVFGTEYFHQGHAATSMKLLILSSTSLLAVVFIIAGVWYGFHFSLGPLVAALEGFSAPASLWQSRCRVRGRGLRYLATLSLAGLLYLGAGSVFYFLADTFVHSRLLLRMIDPAAGAVFGPLMVAAWYSSYQRLTQLKTG
jgi:hypothetical protein